MRCAGQTACIIGASSGIGAALALEFAPTEPICTARAAQRRLADVAARIEAGARALAPTGDVTSTATSSAQSPPSDAFGRLDVAGANAGFGVSAPVESLTLDDDRRPFETNVFGVLRTVHAVPTAGVAAVARTVGSTVGTGAGTVRRVAGRIQRDFSRTSS